MAGVQKRTRNGKVRWVARWRDAHGEAHTKTFDKRSEAAEYGRNQEAADRARPHLSALRRSLTVGEWLQQWLDDIVRIRVAAGRLAPRTAGGYESNVRLYLMPWLSHICLYDLRVADVDELMDGILADGKGPATARQARATLSAALTEAGRADLVDRNVARLARPPAAPRARISTFDDEEYDHIIESAGRHRLGTAIAFGLLTGLRRSELVGLEWADVDVGDASYQIRRTAHRVGQHAARVAPVGLVESAPKTVTSGRRTPMSRLAVAVLQDQRRRQAEERLGARVWEPSGRVWTTT